jgi:hypothetical protein
MPRHSRTKKSRPRSPRNPKNPKYSKKINIEKSSSFKKYVDNQLVDDEGSNISYDGDKLDINFFKNDNEYNLSLNRNEINNFAQSIFGQHANPESLLDRLENDFGIELTPSEQRTKINMGKAKSLIEESPIEYESQAEDLSSKEEAIDSASKALSEILSEYEEQPTSTPHSPSQTPSLPPSSYSIPTAKNAKKQKTCKFILRKLAHPTRKRQSSLRHRHRRRHAHKHSPPILPLPEENILTSLDF